MSTWNGLSRSQLFNLLSWFEFCTKYPRILSVNFSYDSLKNNLKKIEALILLSEKEASFWSESTEIKIANYKDSKVEVVRKNEDLLEKIDYINANLDDGGICEVMRDIEDIDSDPLSFFEFNEKFMRVVMGK